MRSTPSLRMKVKGELVNNNHMLETKKIHIGKKELQKPIRVRIHLQGETVAQEGVPELLEEEEEVMIQVIPVEMKDQIEEKK